MLHMAHNMLSLLTSALVSVKANPEYQITLHINKHNEIRTVRIVCRDQSPM